jgi:hypothetical protein
VTPASPLVAAGAEILAELHPDESYEVREAWAQRIIAGFRQRGFAWIPLPRGEP